MSVVFVLLNVFEEAPILTKTLVRAHLAIPGRKVFVFVDGSYPDWPTGAHPSRDHTPAIADHWGMLVTAPLDECAKRTAGLAAIDHCAHEGDWVLVLDADEELVDITLPDTARVGIITFTRDSDDQTYERARLYRWEKGLAFAGRHYQLHDAHGRLVAGLDRALDSAAAGTGVHHDTGRTPEREQAKALYYRVLQDREALVGSI